MFHYLKNLILLHPYFGIIVILILMIISIIFVIINLMEGRPPLPLNISYNCDTLKYFILPEFKKNIFNLISNFISNIQVFAEELSTPQDKPPTPEIPKNSNILKWIFTTLVVGGIGAGLLYLYSKGWDIFSGWWGGKGPGGGGGIDPTPPGSPSTASVDAKDTTIDRIGGNTTTAIIARDKSWLDSTMKTLKEGPITKESVSIVVEPKLETSPKTPIKSTNINNNTIAGDTGASNNASVNPTAVARRISASTLQPVASEVTSNRPAIPAVLDSQPVISSSTSATASARMSDPSMGTMQLWANDNNANDNNLPIEHYLSNPNRVTAPSTAVVHPTKPLLKAIDEMSEEQLADLRKRFEAHDSKKKGPATFINFNAIPEVPRTMRPLWEVISLRRPIEPASLVDSQSVISPSTPTTASARMSDTPVDNRWANDNSPTIEAADPTLLNYLAVKRCYFWGEYVVVPNADPSKPGTGYLISSRVGQYLLWTLNLDPTNAALLSSKNELMQEFDKWYNPKGPTLRWIITKIHIIMPNAITNGQPEKYELSSDMGRFWMWIWKGAEKQFMLNTKESEDALKLYGWFLENEKSIAAGK